MKKTVKLGLQEEITRIEVEHNLLEYNSYGLGILRVTSDMQKPGASKYRAFYPWHRVIEVLDSDDDDPVDPEFELDPVHEAQARKTERDERADHYGLEREK